MVTGFRGSIQASLNEKRQATVQIDAITAEDIADFPDANLAESLQRLPGVSIDRDNGDGRSITVRGLGGDFNRTRLNGLEALSTAGSNDAGTSPNRSRSFDYNTFASELFSSLKVQKTASAETDEGSLGATIDLETGRPFDYKGTRFALPREASYNQNSKKRTRASPGAPRSASPPTVAWACCCRARTTVPKTSSTNMPGSRARRTSCTVPAISSAKAHPSAQASRRRAM